jgi:hypothetical protein
MNDNLRLEMLKLALLKIENAIKKGYSPVEGELLQLLKLCNELVNELEES